MNAHNESVVNETPRARPASLAWVEALAAAAAIDRHPETLLHHLIESLAGTQGSAPALLSGHECFTFAELSTRIDAYACWAVTNGLSQEDRVALLMSNRPEYVAAWLGLSKAGVVTALINTNLTGRSLAHCLEICRPSFIIAENHLVDACANACPDVSSSGLSPVMMCHGAGKPELRRIDSELENLAGRKLEYLPRLTIDDKALLIYTSGTTGLPKAAYVSHRRVLNWALWFKGLLGNTAADRMYDCLPLYHSVGGVVAVAATLVAGGSTVIAEKFSARHFWDDIRRWNCTEVQYIGELCRYLLNAPPGDRDGHHTLRAAIGNGLRADVWTPFKDRFRIPQIVEFYAATEGNFSLFNAEGKPGSIGRIPPYLRHRFPTAIVEFDSGTGSPRRGSDGFCIAVAVGETGEALGRIGEGSGRFEGYTDARESERKVLGDVFAAGDAWFRTGDLMRNDAAGHFYFVDRAGDTFRWKGENVSTLEVANVLASVPGVIDAVVYGVSVPGVEGKAGMALLETVDGFDFATLTGSMEAQLPAYAVPVFIRIGSSVALTETFKYKKQDLARDGFDPSRSPDPVYVKLPGSGGFLLVDHRLFAELNAGNIRL